MLVHVGQISCVIGVLVGQHRHISLPPECLQSATHATRFTPERISERICGHKKTVALREEERAPPSFSTAGLREEERDPSVCSTPLRGGGEERCLSLGSREEERTLGISEPRHPQGGGERAPPSFSTSGLREEERDPSVCSTPLQGGGEERCLSLGSREEERTLGVLCGGTLGEEERGCRQNDRPREEERAFRNLFGAFAPVFKCCGAACDSLSQISAEVNGRRPQGGGERSPPSRRGFQGGGEEAGQSVRHRGLAPRGVGIFVAASSGRRREDAADFQDPREEERGLRNSITYRKRLRRPRG